MRKAETTFETDEVTGLLENRWSGQGHRAALNRQRLERGDSWEDFDVRFGEERRMYIQEKGGQPHQHFSKDARRGQDRFRDLLSDNVKTPQQSNHTRAPDPRQFGTVKFKPGGTRTVIHTTATPVVSVAGLEARAALRRSVANAGLAVNQRDRKENEDPAAASLRAKWANVDAASKTSPASTASLSASDSATLRAKWSTVDATPKPVSMPTAPVATVNAASLQAESSGVNATSKSIPVNNTAARPATTTTKPTTAPNIASPVVAPWVHAQKCRNLARWHAAKGGKECDEYHEKYPDRKQYLYEAREELITEAIGLLKQEDDIEILAELKLHPEYEWIFDKARIAKKLVEENDNSAAAAELNKDKNFATFLCAARAAFMPKQVPMPIEAHASSSEDSSDSNGNGNNSSDTDDSVQTTVSTPPPQKPGGLIATFFSAAGALLGSHHASLAAPVRATMSFSSRADHFDPRQLIAAIDNLAQSMMDRTKGLEGVKLADDGLWVDEEL